MLLLFLDSSDFTVGSKPGKSKFVGWWRRIAAASPCPFLAHDLVALAQVPEGGADDMNQAGEGKDQYDSNAKKHV